MSSSDYIQKTYAADEIASSTDLGQSSTQDSNRNQVEIFVAGETIAAGAAVSLDLSKANNGLRLLVIKELDATDACPVGICVDGAASGEKVEVVVKGIVESALVDGSSTNVAVGDALYFGSAAGKLEAQPIDEGASATFNLKAPCAVAIEATSADAASRVYVIKNF